MFCEKLAVLRRHEFIAKQQSSFCKKRREQLEDGEFLVIGDFAENYSFILQDAAQGYHWNNAQATLHPFVAYYQEYDEDKDKRVEKCVSVVMISSCMNHDTAVVYLFQKRLIEFLKGKFQNVQRIFYFSDGAASQYKNCKNFINLCYHEQDFGVQAEWNFFATSHGKGPCDGVGGTVKRLAARASLQRAVESDKDPIMTPRQLYEFGRDSIQGILSFAILLKI